MCDYSKSHISRVSKEIIKTAPIPPADGMVACVPTPERGRKNLQHGYVGACHGKPLCPSPIFWGGGWGWGQNTFFKKLTEGYFLIIKLLEKGFIRQVQQNIIGSLSTQKNPLAIWHIMPMRENLFMTSKER